MGVWMEGWVEGWIDGSMEQWTDVGMDGWMAVRCIHKWTDGQTDG